MPLPTAADLAATLVRCAAPSKKYRDGRCPNLVSAESRHDQIYCSKRCKHRSYKERRRNRTSTATLADRVLSQLQAARTEDGARPLRVHPVLQALARHRAAEKLLEDAQEAHPDYRPAPRYLGGVVPAEQLAQMDAVPRVPIDAAEVGVEVVPRGKGRYLVVMVLA